MTLLSPSVIEFALRLFIRYCGAEAGSIVAHHSDLGHYIGQLYSPTIHQAMAILPNSALETLLFLPMRQLLSAGSDIEETDGFGRTALLGLVEGVKRSQFVDVSNMLLQHGADPLAVDNGDAGMLHYILRTTLACSKAHTKKELFYPL